MMVTALKWKINADSDSHHTVRDSGEGGKKKSRLHKAAGSQLLRTLQPTLLSFDIAI